MKARGKASDSKSARFVQSLNGSGVAIGCALIAVLENYQSRDEIPRRMAFGLSKAKKDFQFVRQ